MVFDPTAILVTLLASIPGVWALLCQRRTAQETHRVSEAAGIISGYERLCKRLEGEIVIKGQEIENLRARLVAIEQHEREWAEEREALRCRIAKLEEERDSLRTKLEDLRVRYCGEV